jgi:hypothetical protein
VPFSGDGYDFAGTPAQLLFGGSPSVTLGVAEAVASDPLVFTIDETKNYVLTAYFATTSSVGQFISTGCLAWSKAGDDAAVVDTTGHGASVANSVRLFSKIEVGT